MSHLDLDFEPLGSRDSDAADDDGHHAGCRSDGLDYWCHPDCPVWLATQDGGLDG